MSEMFGLLIQPGWIQPGTLETMVDQPSTRNRPGNDWNNHETTG